MRAQLVLRAMGLPEIAVSAGSDAFDWDGAWAADLKAGYASAVDVQWGLPRHTDTTVFDDHCFLTALFRCGRGGGWEVGVRSSCGPERAEQVGVLSAVKLL